MDISDETLEDQTVVVSLNGRLDPMTAGCVEKRLSELVEQGIPKLVVDLSRLVYISSAGLRVLLTTAKQVGAQKAKFVLCGAQQHVKEVFDISGFSAILNICESREQAIGG